MSFYTSLSGLQASQTEMNTISHNLANVATNGFKKSRTDFADVIASSVSLSPTLMTGSGTVVKGNIQQFGQGNLIQSSSSLDLAISGDGFFAIKPQLDGAKVDFTRNGSFSVNQDHFVTDAQGNYLQVYPVDGSGAVVATGIDQTKALQLPQTSGTAKPTSLINMTANLPSTGSIPVTATFDRFDPTSYNQSTSTTIYDTNGSPQTLTTYFKRTAASTGAGVDSTWEVYNYVGDTKLSSGGSDHITLTFDSNGTLTAPTSATTFDPFTPAGATTAQTAAFSFGAATAQLAQPFNIASRTQDGAAIGQIEGVTVGDDGMVKASFSNGDIQALGKVVLAKFTDPAGLRQLGDSTWSATGLSGEPQLGSAGMDGFGNLMSSTIERSNVDITEELVNLIAAQRNFQANAKALDTASQISETIFNIRS
ncbi:flagellar hook protein FlgE [Sphingomonas sp.]|jgi:flagellar hook protein FlgE|uniref:flagellar hook protein FlgE n=1 Tax=Sphingomonas sp. TaxID=28214 RepID=UPI002E325EF4|nr:flagellar hook protein FlgE [Sphingomonas sp.]HEX4694576.1 flagellar hook protein FlgE [Sphingomonas sp.]